MSRLCSAIGQDASVVFVDAGTANSLSQVVRGVCGQPAASAAGASPLAISQVVGSIARADRRPVLLGASRSQLAVFGASLGGNAATGAVAAHGRGRRGADRAASRHVAGDVHGLDGRAGLLGSGGGL